MKLFKNFLKILFIGFAGSCINFFIDLGNIGLIFAIAAAGTLIISAIDEDKKK